MTELRDIKHTIQLHTNSGAPACPACGDHLRVSQGMPMSEAINHLLRHGYELLHVGAERDSDPDTGKSIHHTVAILGSTTSQPETQKPEIYVGGKKIS